MTTNIKVDRERLEKNIPEIFKQINLTAYMVRNFGFMCGFQDIRDDSEALSDSMYNLAAQFKMLAKEYNECFLKSKDVADYFRGLEVESQ